MKNQSLYEQLHRQYTRLKQRLERAVTSGRFARFSTFRQQQWLQGVQRCRLQLVRAGAGMAVVATLSLPQTVEAQVPTYNFTERTGMANALDTIDHPYSQLHFVDLDDDRDLDLVMDWDYTYNVTNGAPKYYRNEGNTSTPRFVQQFGPTNLLNVSPRFNNASSHAFVDIDGDGDLDMFAANKGTALNYAKTTNFYYAKNEGSNPRSPIFDDHTDSTDNPLTDVVPYINSLNLPGDAAPRVSFTDIDNDGDQDCFVSVNSYYGWPGNIPAENKLLYYENVGGPAAPNFQRRGSADNPLAAVVDSLDRFQLTRAIHFYDFDRDGDIDGVANSSSGRTRIFYIENLSTPGNVNYVVRAEPFAQQIVNSVSLSWRVVAWGDLTGDGLLDGFATTGPLSGNTVADIRFFETTSIVLGVHQLPQTAKTLTVFPNPTKGNIAWAQPLTGTLRVFNTLGQEVFQTTIVEAQDMALSLLPAGTYVLTVATEEDLYQQTLIIR